MLGSLGQSDFIGESLRERNDSINRLTRADAEDDSTRVQLSQSRKASTCNDTMNETKVQIQSMAVQNLRKARVSRDTWREPRGGRKEDGGGKTGKSGREGAALNDRV